MCQGQYCNETRWNPTTITVPENYTERISYQNSFGSLRYRLEPRVRMVTKLQYVPQIVSTCCKGYLKKRNGECIPNCQKPCSNGKCTAPNECTCDKGYKYLTQFKCQPKCDNCNHGVCSAPGICDCYPDFKKSDNGTCIPICYSECVNGFCSAFDTCSCNEGYYLNETIKYATESPTANISRIICQPHCNENCINGYCSAPNICSCNEGYKKNSANKCIPNCKFGCENGICAEPDQCFCFPNYEMNNYLKKCQPVCTNGCINGNCTEPEICECNNGFKMQKGSVSHCEPKCDPECEDGEFCNGPNECRCAIGYIKNLEVDKCVPNCSLKCINSDCISPYECECWEGYKKDSIQLNKCNPICDDCDDIRCIKPNQCLTTTTELLNILSETSTIENNYKNLMYSDYEELSFSSSSSTEPDYDDILQTETDFSIRAPRSWNDNTCHTNCINGICLNGDCYCEDGYNGLDCPEFCETNCTNGYRYELNNSCTCFPNNIDELEIDNCDSYCNLNNSEFYICILPSRCNCTEGYIKNSIGLCVPSCTESPLNYSILSDCINGTCVAPNICECDDPKMILNQTNKFECIETKHSQSKAILNNVIRNSNMARNLWFACLVMLVLAAIIILSVIAYKKQKDYNVDKKEKDFGAYRYKNGTVSYDDPN